MIRISQIKLPLNHNEKDLKNAIIKQLKLKSDNRNLQYRIIKKSIDARKNELKYIYSVDVDLPDENKIIKKSGNSNITISQKKEYTFVNCGSEKLSSRPIIIGCGPAGLFCAYMLAGRGYRPIVIERGGNVDERTASVNQFFEGSTLDPESNVQFGEGGAGTFSDGKLNTMVKDKFGRNDFILETFVKFGADEKILYLNKPHIGTDVLSVVVKNMRNEAIRLGADFMFHTKMTDFSVKDNRIHSIEIMDKEGNVDTLPCSVLVLAIGHSARDTFAKIYNKKLLMEPKSFAVGVRIEHPQEQINESQYGKYKDSLPAADYKLAVNLDNGRGVYSFCMCPGGYVVNSSSEAGYTAVNGMSYSGRNGRNANSAIIVTVTPSDFPDCTPLGGLALQRTLEQAAYMEGKSKIPIQLFGDFKNNTTTTVLGDVIPQTKGATEFSNLRNIFPDYISDSLIKGIDFFSGKIKGYNRADAVLSGVESRTSSPLRILRNGNFESNVDGIYPCGEGAGYAGGITSAAMDGIKVYEAVSKKYAPLTD